MNTTKTILAIVFAVAIVLPGHAQENSWSYLDTIYPPRRFCTGSALDGKIYVIGGQFWGGTGPHVIAYDLATGTVDTTPAELAVPITGATSCVVNGKIYLIGGSNDDFGYLNTVLEYDPTSNAWTIKAPMPTPRNHLASVVIEEKIYALGGGNNYLPELGAPTAVEVYDPATNAWTTKASMLHERTRFTAQVVGGKIYVMGGNPNTASVEAYDPLTNIWTEIGEVPIEPLWYGSATVRGQIYIFGGFAGDFLQPPTWKFDPPTGSWSDLGVAMPLDIAGFATAVVDDCIYTLGGMNSATIPIGDIYRFCPTITSTRQPEQSPNPAVLFQNYPNPFASSTRMEYALRQSGWINISVCNLAGQEVATVFAGPQTAGRHEVTWTPEGLPGGVYIIRLQTEDYTVTRKCVLQY